MTTADRIANALRAIAPGGKLGSEDVPLIDKLAANWEARGRSRKLADPSAFFTKLRAVTGPLNQRQVDTVQGLLSAASHWPLSWVAYAIATAWHEARLEPIEEWGRGKGKAYGNPAARLKPKAGAPTYGGQIPYGRGLPQLTWVENYEWADQALGLNGKLLANFDLALDLTTSTQILVKGMETGHFTGKKLGDYLPDRLGTLGDFTDARRIINGTDRAAIIAGIAMKVQDALVAGGWA